MSGLKHAASDLLLAALLALPGAAMGIAALLVAPDMAHAATTGEPLEFAFTVGTDLAADACATTTDIAVGYGDQVNYCYRIVNHGDETLRFHTLHDDAAGRLLTLEPIDIAPGASYQFNHIAAANDSRTVTADWRALAAEPGYVVEENDPQILFADGFDADGRVQYGFIDISETGQELELTFQNYQTPLQLPFEFDLFGIVSDQLALVEYGAAAWDTQRSEGISYSTGPLNSQRPPGLFPLWDDFFQSGGRFFFQVLGEAPNRRAVVQWHELRHNDLPDEAGSVTFQMILEEGSNRVLFNYADATFGDPGHDYGRSATIGLNSGAQFRVQYSRLEASLDDHFTIRFTPQPIHRYAAQAEVHLDVGAPVIEVQPGTLTATVAAGGSSESTLSIGNIGTRDLLWSLDEAPARMHFPTTPRIGVPIAPASTGTPPTLPRVVAPMASLPAFAWMDSSNESFVSLDVIAPNGTVNVIDDYVRRFLLGGDFIDGDFSAYYGLDWWSNQLVRMLTVNCNCVDQVVVIGPPGNPAGGPQPSEGNWVGMTYDSSNGQIYAVAASSLYRIDLPTVQAWELGPITGVAGNPAGGTRIEDIAVSPEGLMYGVEAIGDNLVAIDKVTGEAAIIGSLGIDLDTGYRPQIGLEFDDASGDLYLIANLGIHSVNTATGASSYIGSTGEFPLDSLAIATTSPCSRAEEIPWLSAPQTSGVQAPGVSAPVAVTFDAAGLAVGTYTANLCVANNDPLHGRVIVPVSLTVN